MLYYDWIDVSERIDTNIDICHYWYFLNKGFKFQLYIINRCHDVLLILMILLFQAYTLLIITVSLMESAKVMLKFTKKNADLTSPYIK